MEKCFRWFTLIYGHILQNFIEIKYEILIGRQFLETYVSTNYSVLHENPETIIKHLRMPDEQNSKHIH
jgi:hypothetical protein